MASDQADEELALAAEEDIERDADAWEPGNSDEDAVRDFHRAVVHRAGRTLSGRML